MKGIAILAMLFHHMYGAPPPEVEPYTGVLAWIGVLGKVCVAMFLFCSGYGLAAQYKPISIKDDIKFILRRLTKFYLNYWVIFIIFVPITYFVFGRTLTDAYGEHVNITTSHFLRSPTQLKGLFPSFSAKIPLLNTHCLGLKSFCLYCLQRN